jgi:hypothetical protein
LFLTSGLSFDRLALWADRIAPPPGGYVYHVLNRANARLRTFEEGG